MAKYVLSGLDSAPAIWMLTSSGESAYLAAHMGLALSYAQFINPIGGVEAMAIYRERFKTVALLKAPTGNVGRICVLLRERTESSRSAGRDGLPLPQF